MEDTDWIVGIGLVELLLTETLIARLRLLFAIGAGEEEAFSEVVAIVAFKVGVDCETTAAFVVRDGVSDAVEEERFTVALGESIAIALLLLRDEVEFGLTVPALTEALLVGLDGVI